jgi:hypothetical protein
MIVKFIIVVHLSWIHSLSDELVPPKAFTTREEISTALLQNLKEPLTLCSLGLSLQMSGNR